MLRFKNIKFPNGGNFKVCLCDTELLTTATNKVCQKKEDYKVEVGKLQVSGVSCLLKDNRYTKGTCVPQYPISKQPSGMRCYTAASSDPTVTVNQVQILFNDLA